MAQDLDRQLVTAVKNGDVDTLQQLIENGADVDCTDEDDVSTKCIIGPRGLYNHDIMI